MKTKLNPTHLLAAVILCGLIAGCGTPLTDMSKQSALQIGSPLRGVPKRTIKVREFADTRNCEANLTSGWPPFRLTQPVAEVVRNAVVGEFQRNGHVCLNPDDGQPADFLLEAAVYQYNMTYKGGVAAPDRFTADVGVKLTVSSTTNPNISYVKRYEGNYYETRLISWKHLEGILEEATLNMLKEMTTDPDLVKFLADQQAPRP